MKAAKGSKGDMERRYQASRKQFLKDHKEITNVVVPKLIQFLVELGSEGERSAVVLGAERVNVAVEQLVKAFLRPSPTQHDSLFSSDGAVATFSRKTDIAYRLGLIDLQFKRALDLVRKLRNDFAHATKVETLEVQSHAGRVEELRKMIAKGSQKSLEELELAFVKGAGRGKFVTAYLACVMLLLGKLEIARHRIKRPRIRLPVKLDFRDED